MGTMIGPLSTIVLYHVDVHHAGSASGVLSSVHQFGAAVGVAVAGTAYFGTLKDAPAGLQGYVNAFDTALTIQVIGLLAAAVLSLQLPNIRGFMVPPSDFAR